jgi:hypothetical protein
MTPVEHAAPARPALVTRSHLKANDPDEYLQLTPAGAALWTSDPAAATAFESMRDAIRAAARLPSALRAFGLPLRAEMLARSALN